MLAPRLYIEIWSNSSSTFGPSTCKAVISDALNVGWARYSRFPGSAFFTLRQESANNALLVPGLDHIRMYFTDEAQGYGPVLVFAGRVGDPDESGEDVIWQCWDYLAELSLSLSGFRRLYPNKKIGTEIAQEEWEGNSGDWLLYGAKVQTKSRLAHIATGTFQDPNDSLGSPITTDVRFGVIKVPRLLLMFDLTELGRANTDNNVTYEITRSTSPQFNFWANHGSTLTDKRLTLPGTLNDFRFVPGVMGIRNKLATIGESIDGGAVAIEKEVSAGTYGYNNFGLMEDVFSIKTLAGMTASTTFESQQMVTERAVNEATQLTAALLLDVRPHLFLPFDGWEIEDIVRVQIERAGTSIDADYRIIGIRGQMDGSGYRQSMFVQLPVSA